MRDSDNVVAFKHPLRIPMMLGRVYIERAQSLKVGRDLARFVWHTNYRRGRGEKPQKNKNIYAFLKIKYIYIPKFIL